MLLLRSAESAVVAVTLSSILVTIMCAVCIIYLTIFYIYMYNARVCEAKIIEYLYAHNLGFAAAADDDDDAAARRALAIVI